VFIFIPWISIPKKTYHERHEGHNPVSMMHTNYRPGVGPSNRTARSSKDHRNIIPGLPIGSVQREIVVIAHSNASSGVAIQQERFRVGEIFFYFLLGEGLVGRLDILFLQRLRPVISNDTMGLFVD